MQEKHLLKKALKAARKAAKNAAKLQAAAAQQAAYEKWRSTSSVDGHDINCPRTGRGCPQCNGSGWRDSDN